MVIDEVPEDAVIMGSLDKKLPPWAPEPEKTSDANKLKNFHAKQIKDLKQKMRMMDAES